MVFLEGLVTLGEEVRRNAPMTVSRLVRPDRMSLIPPQVGMAAIPPHLDGEIFLALLLTDNLSS